MLEGRFFLSRLFLENPLDMIQCSLPLASLLPPFSMLSTGLRFFWGRWRARATAGSVFVKGFGSRKTAPPEQSQMATARVSWDVSYGIAFEQAA